MKIPAHPFFRWTPLWVALAAGLAFVPVLKCGFIDWDDGAVLLANPMYRGLSLDHLRWMFTSVYMGHYMPLTWLSYAVDYRLWGLNPLGYHAVNGLIHAANAVLVFFLARQLLGRVWGNQDERLTLCAGAAALLFSLHPLRVESVAWVTQRRDVLAAFFLLLSVNLYVKGAEERAERPGLYLGLSWAAYVLSLLSKSLGMLLPVVLAVLDIYPLRRLPGDTRTWFHREHLPVWVEKLLFGIPAAGAMLMATLAQSLWGAAVTLEEYHYVARAAQAGYGLFFYIFKTLWPAHLSPLYEIPENFYPFTPFYLLCVVSAVGMTLLLFRQRRRRPAFLAAWACYVILFLPTSGLLQSGPQFVADRYSYLSMLGAAILAGAGAGIAWDRWPGARSWTAGAVTLALVLLAAATWRQCGVWQSSRTLWTRVLEREPRSTIANSGMGMVLLGENSAEESLVYLRRALTLRPHGSYDGAHHNIALAYAQLGRLSQASFHERMAIQLNPRRAESHAGLGYIYMRMGRPADAVAEFEKAVELNPGAGVFRRSLAEAKEKLK